MNSHLSQESHKNLSSFSIQMTSFWHSRCDVTTAGIPRQTAPLCTSTLRYYAFSSSNIWFMLTHMLVLRILFILRFRLALWACWHTPEIDGRRGVKRKSREYFLTTVVNSSSNRTSFCGIIVISLLLVILPNFHKCCMHCPYDTLEAFVLTVWRQVAVVVLTVAVGRRV